MPELEPQNAPGDPIASLHKMSTTAGISTREYVAINNLAIAACVMGVATALAFVGMPFLFLGAVAVLAGAVALRQIRNSNGTQGGRGLAWLGIVLAVGISAAVVGLNVASASALRPEKEAINAVIAQMGQHLMKGEYRQAYALTDPEFQQRVPFEQFERQWQVQQDPVNGGGPLQVFRGNNVFDFVPGGDGRLAAYTKVEIRYQNSPLDGRMTMTLRKTEGQWQANTIEIFERRRR